MMKRFWMVLVFGWSCLTMASVSEQFSAPLTASTFDQMSTHEMIHDVRLTQRTLSFTLNDPIWHYTYNGSPIDFVGSQVTVKSVSLPDLVTNTANLNYVSTVTILDERGGVVCDATAKEEVAQVRLPAQNGTYAEARVYKYTFGEGVVLNTNATYKLRLVTSAATPPLLPVFRNASSEYTDADQSFVRIDGGDPLYSPYLSFDGTMTMKRFRYDLTAGTHSLSAQLATDNFTDATDDAVDTMVVVRFMESDAILTMDHSLNQAALVVASNTPATTWTKPAGEGEVAWQPATRAGTVRFINGYTFKGPVDFRDVAGAEGEIKMIRLEYDGAGAPVIPREIWAPITFALHCDLELAAYPDMLIDSDAQSSWFGRNPLTIPAGRSIRIVTHIDENNKPNIIYGDATSRLALAIPTSEPHILSHYRELIEQNSGILRMVSPFTIPLKEGNTSLVLGVDNDAATPPSVQTLQSYESTEFVGSLVLGYGVNNNAQYVQKAGTVTVGGEGLILGQGDAAMAKYIVQQGEFHGQITFGAQVHDAALIVGDGEGEANSAKATVPVLLAQPAGSTETITGTAEVMVNTDGQLVLEGDLNMTPSLRRRMTLNGGTLKATGATPTYTFGTDFVNGGGLAVNGDVLIDASEATPRFQKAAAEKADMKMEFEGNNAIVVKDAQAAWFTAWGGNAPSSYIDTPSGKGFVVSNIVTPYASVTPPAESDYSIVLGANLENVTAENAVLFSVGSWDNALALRKRGNTIEVIRYDGSAVTVDASYTSDTLTSGWHLFVVAVDHDIHVKMEGEEGKEVVTKTITATKVTLSVDGVSTAGTMLTPFIFTEYLGFQIGAGYSNAGYSVTATNLQVDNCYIWDRALTAGEVRALRPTLTIDALSGMGEGSLTVNGTVTIDNLGYFKGTIQAQSPSSDDALDGGSIRLNALHGITSDITFGYLGRRDTSVVADILALTHKDEVAPYRGILSFDATQYPMVDVSETEELDVYARLRIQNGQTLRIRLDQFADATILWPENIDEANPPKLEIVEAGAYGGELLIPHLPEIVAQNLVFYHYDHNNILVPHYQNTWTITPNEDGAYDTFEWEYPNFAHNSAWIDAEFEGNSYNTGWMRVGKHNALLKGTDWNGSVNMNSYGSVMTEEKFFTDTRNPAGKGVKLCYRPYIELSDLQYPKVWSAAVRLTAPRKANTTLLALSSTCGGAYNPKLPDGDALILATGETVGQTGPIPIVLYRAIDHAITGETYNVAAPDELVPVATAYIADISEIPHVISVVCDGKLLTVYLDGGLLTEYLLPENWVGLATGGLQVGQILSGSSNTGDMNNLRSAEPDDGGYVDYIRFYKGALTAKAMAALAEEAPPVYQGVRYVRDVTEDGLWEDAITKPWHREAWNGSAWVHADEGEARPAEGAEIRLFVKGDCTLQVNTEKDAVNGFLSANRFYSALNVLPHTEASKTTGARLVLQPIGGEVTFENQKMHEWMTAKEVIVNADSTTAEGDELRYGTIKFVGGGNDAIHPKAAYEADGYDNPHSALGVHGRRSVEKVGGTPTPVSDEVTVGAESAAESVSKVRWQKTRTVTQTRLYRRNFTGGDVAATFAPSAGVAQFSRLASVLVGGVSTTTGTETMTATRTITQTQSGLGNNKNNITWSNLWEPAYAADSDDNWSAWNETGWITESVAADGELVPATLELHADYSLIRGREEEETDFLHLTGKIEGRGKVVGNAEIEQPNANGQVSEYVWVPAFNDGVNWILTDVTNSIYGENSNPGGTVAGLLAEIRQIPGRLYLDLSDTEITDIRDFFEAFDANTNTGLPWYRYGYKDDANASPAPVLATQADMGTAIAFQIRVPEGIWKIHANKSLPSGSGRLIATLHIENGATDKETVPTLKLLSTSGNGAMYITKQLITSVRLEDVGEQVNGELGGTSTLVTLESALIHGHTTGTYAFKNRTFSRPMVSDSIATLEVHGKANYFWHNFELRDTHLVIADDAILEQDGEANHLWAKSLTMGKDAIFRFHAAGEDSESNGVVFTENVKMTGPTATLHGYGQADGVDNTHRCNFTAAAIEGPMDQPAVLTLNSAGNERWICYTASLIDHTATGGSLGLTKVGTGIMAFRSPTPPTVTGPVRVEEGKLRVGTEPFSDDALNLDQHLTAAIGHSGLHVAAGASLEPNHYANPEDIIACIKGGQTLSGTGMIGGVLRLNRDAQLSDSLGMTVRKIVVDGSMVADVQVVLPDAVKDGDVLFHILDDTARTEVRRRFYAATFNGERWDVGVNHDAGESPKVCQSHYVVYRPGVPVPQNPSMAEGNVYDPTIESILIRYYQGYNVARLTKTDGRTMVQMDPETHATSYYALNAAEIGNAFRCFSNIWTFAPVAGKEDESDLLMAYEFGISDLVIRELADTSAEGRSLYVVVKVAVENKLAVVFDSTILGSGNKADFQLNTVIDFDVGEGTFLSGTELATFEEKTLPTVVPQTHTPGVRFYAIPLTEANFPLGTTELTARIRRTDLN